MVDTSLFEAGIVHTYWQSAICFATGVSPGPLGSGHPLSAPYQALPASDGWLTIGASNQSNWLRLVDAIGAPELSEDERFLDNGARMANLPELVEVLTAIFQQRSVAEWLEKLERAGVPAGPVLDIAQMHADPQTLARKMVVDVPHPRHGAVKTIGAPVKFSGMGEAIRRPAPALGEHTKEVLAEIGIAPVERESLPPRAPSPLQARSRERRIHEVLKRLNRELGHEHCNSSFPPCRGRCSRTLLFLPARPPRSNPVSMRS